MPAPALVLYAWLALAGLPRSHSPLRTKAWRELLFDTCLLAPQLVLAWRLETSASTQPELLSLVLSGLGLFLALHWSASRARRLRSGCDPYGLAWWLGVVMLPLYAAVASWGERSQRGAGALLCSSPLGWLYEAARPSAVALPQPYAAAACCILLMGMAEASHRFAAPEEL